MDDFVAKYLEDDSVKIETKQLQHEIDVNGVSDIENFLRKRLETYQEIEVNVAVTGDSGAGKSSFINAIRGLTDDDHKAAKVGVTRTTLEPSRYGYPTSPKILFWDIPGIGTPNYPDLETYVQKVQLEKYDTFLILTYARFTMNDLLLAKKISSMKKSFFFIRTKIDVDFTAASRQTSFDEEAMLMEIRRECAENLGDLLSNKEDIFLISNHEPDKWDFKRLKQAILDALTRYQQESLNLSLDKSITGSSREIFQIRVNVLKARIWKLAAVSAAAAIAPFPGVSVAVDAVLILRELSLYRSQLGLPAVGSAEFAKLSIATKEKILQVALTTAAEVSGFLAPYAAEATVEEVVRYFPFVGVAIASAMSFGATLYALYQLLGAVEDAALSFLKEAHKKILKELKIE